MKNLFGLTQLGLLFSVSALLAGEPNLPSNDSLEEAVLISIIYDNYQFDSRLKTDWGFACLVEFKGQKLLFDATTQPVFHGSLNQTHR